VQPMRDGLAVVVREGLKGNHLLFATQDLAAASDRQDVSASVAGELGAAGMALIRAASITEARLLIDGLSAPCRAALARLYLRFLARCALARGDAN